MFRRKTPKHRYCSENSMGVRFSVSGRKKLKCPFLTDSQTFSTSTKYIQTTTAWVRSKSSRCWILPRCFIFSDCNLPSLNAFCFWEHSFFLHLNESHLLVPVLSSWLDTNFPFGDMDKYLDEVIRRNKITTQTALFLSFLNISKLKLEPAHNSLS